MPRMLGRTLGNARWARGLGVALVLALLAAAGSVALGPGASAARAATAPRPAWLLDSHAVDLLRHAGVGDALLGQAFGRARGYVPGRPERLGVPTVTYYSYQAIKKAFADRALPGRYRAVLLDMEHWKYTPKAEQDHPARYEKLAADLVHQHRAGGRRMLLIDAPATDIVKARCKCADDGAARRQYLTWDIAGGAARYADVIDIQAQNVERSLASYRAFVATAARQARRAHRGVIILAGLSTDNGPREVSGGQLYQAYRAVRGLVAGFWLNIPARSGQCGKCRGPYPQPALSLLRRIYG